MIRHNKKFILPLFVLMLTILSCRLPRVPEVDPGDTNAVQTGTAVAVQEDLRRVNTVDAQTAEANHGNSTVDQPTLEAIVSPTNTNLPSATLHPSQTPFPRSINTPPPNAEQIYFKKGGTSAYVSHHISIGQRPAYILGAAEGQTMIVGVSSSNNDVYLDIQGLQFGQHLLSRSAQKLDWSGVLPGTQMYLITLDTKNTGTDYFLKVEIPTNIIFASGEDSTTIDGYVDVHSDLFPNLMTRVSYLAYAFAGQTMSISITSPNIDSLSLGIYGQSDGQPYKRYEVRGVSGSLELSTTQGYFIDVYSTGGISTEFTLEITIR